MTSLKCTILLYSFACEYKRENFHSYISRNVIFLSKVQHALVYVVCGDYIAYCICTSNIINLVWSIRINWNINCPNIYIERVECCPIKYSDRSAFSSLTTLTVPWSPWWARVATIWRLCVDIHWWCMLCMGYSSGFHMPFIWWHCWRSQLQVPLC